MALAATKDLAPSLPRSPWILDQWSDLSCFILSPLFSTALLGLFLLLTRFFHTDLQSTERTFFLWFLIGFDRPHIVQTFSRTHFDAIERRRHAFFHWGLLGGMLAGHRFASLQLEDERQKCVAEFAVRLALFTNFFNLTLKFLSVEFRNSSVQQVNQMLQVVALEDWKTYLRCHLARVAAPLLSSAFVNENFDFYGRYLTGQKEIQARWKRCVSFTDRLLGEAVGQAYVAETFGPEGKERAQKMVVALEKALEKDIRTLAWMTPATKEKAVGKLHAITNKIGYPDKWRDYSALKIQAGDWFGNFLGSLQAEFNRQMGKIGKPADKKEWSMTPPTVNAYYSPPNNDINFPAGILQPPFFDKKIDDDVNFGSIGAVIGHELTHGFDDQGRKFDPQGNLRDWWTEQDGKEFEQRASCVADEYGSFIAIDDLKLNGKLTLGENTADNGGARIALMALMSMIAEDKTGKAAEKIDGYTPEQRFYLGFARVWCEKRRPEFSRMLVNVDPHSPGRFRTNGVVQNMPEFEKAWGCKAGQPMVRENQCRVW